MGDSNYYHRLLMVDRGIGLYEQRAYAYSWPARNPHYLVVRGPVFLPDRVDEQRVVSRYHSKSEALTTMERLAQAQFQGESEESSESPPQPHSKEISGHRASSMPRGSGIIYATKHREGYDPRDYNGVIVTTDTGRPYWVVVWRRKVNGREALEVQLSPKVD
jgi:hypothetical protein